MSVTKKSHYNPCFWTAYWNLNYLQLKREETKTSSKPREVEIFCLNVKGNKILKLKTKNVFFVKGAGIADLSQENALDYSKREVPEVYDELKAYYEKHPGSLILDFENHFSDFEDSYKSSLEKVITRRVIKTIEDKTLLSFFILIQTLRNHRNQSLILSVFDVESMAKLESFIALKNMISNPHRLRMQLHPLLYSEWKLYNTEIRKFPLPDNPVLINPLHILVPLAPDMLLEVNMKEKADLEGRVCTVYDSIPQFVYKDFKRRAIRNANLELISGDRAQLERWQKSKTYKRHIEQLNRTAK